VNSFTWNGIDSQAMGLWVESLPPVTRPPARYQQVSIPGRSGALTIKEGTDVYDPYVREVRCMPRPGADLHAILKWLSPDVQADVTFSNEPDRIQRAWVLDQIDFAHAFADQREGVIRFLCEPFKRSSESDQRIQVDLTQTAGTQIPNPGDVVAWPSFLMIGSGEVSITLNSTEFVLDIPQGYGAQVDTEAGVALVGIPLYGFDFVGLSDTEPAVMYGDFPHLRTKYSNDMTWLGDITTLYVTPHWRYL